MLLSYQDGSNILLFLFLEMDICINVTVVTVTAVALTVIALMTVTLVSVALINTYSLIV